MPPIGQVHIDRALTNVSIAYKNEYYIADQILPSLPVDKRSDKYFIYDKSTFLRNTALDNNNKPLSLRRPKAHAAEIDYSLSNDSFYCQEYALSELVADAEKAYQDSPLSAEIDSVEFLTERLKLDNEIMAAKLVGDASNYPTANKVTLTTGGSGTSWAQYASSNSKPLNNIRDGKVQVRKGVMRNANTLMMTTDVAMYLADHPDIKDLIKYTSKDALTVSGLPAVVRGLQVIEGDAQRDSSAEGATFSGTNVWQDSGGNSYALVLYVGKDTGPKTMHFGRTFEAPDDTTGKRGWSVRKWRDEPRKGMMVEVSTLRDHKLIAVDGSNDSVAGYLMLSAIV